MNQIKEDFSNEMEVDIPLSDSELNTNEKRTVLMTSKKVDSYEDELEKQARYHEKMDKYLYKRHAFHLLIGCGITYLFLVILDMIVSNLFGWNPSDLLDRFIELLKFVISTLIGYVFSENHKHKNE